MRIVSGRYGGIRLNPVKSDKTRPTTDKVKESLFSITGPYFEGGRFLDLFAGSGAVGIEAVSRGMEEAVLVDRQFQAFKTIKENIAKVHAENQFKVMKTPADKAMAQLASDGERFDMVYLDPPYKQQQILKTMASLVDLKLLQPGAFIICETDNHTELPDVSGPFNVAKRKDYGLTQLTIYRYVMEK